MSEKVTNEDCMEMMARHADNFFELAIVDPPYGIKESAHRNISRSKLAATKMYRKTVWDQHRPSSEYFAEVQRVSKNQIIFGGNYFADLLPPTSCYIVWDKVNDGTNFADAELAWTSFKSATRIFRFMWNGMMQGTPGNGTKMLGDKRRNEKRIHPTQKPVVLYKWILQHYAKAGDKILDTHLGSQSSRIAAFDLGFDFYGTELDEIYYHEACERFADYLGQERLFAPETVKAEQITLFK
jgi:site-specific DNA-methyltransferase (adenine-specific)